MKKIASFLFLLMVSFQPSVVKADYTNQTGIVCYDPFQCCDPYQELLCCYHDITIEAKISGYFPLNSRVSEIYGDALPDFEIQLATTWCNFQPWISLEYIWSNGHSLGGHNKTALSLLPLGFGVNYLFPICDRFTAYIGGGALYSFFRTEDHAASSRKHIRKDAWGGTAKLGVYYFYTDCLFFEGFLDYAYQKFNFHNSNSNDPDAPFIERNDADLSGIKLGFGVGGRF